MLEVVAQRRELHRRAHAFTISILAVLAAYTGGVSLCVCVEYLVPVRGKSMMVQLGEGDGRSGSGMSFIDRTGGGIICDEDCVVSRQTTGCVYIYIYINIERQREIPGRCELTISMKLSSVAGSLGM